MTSSLKPRKTPYPAFTLLSSIALLAYFYLQTQTDLRLFYRISDNLFSFPVPELLLAGYCLLIWSELRLIQRHRRHQDATLQNIHSQMEELLENKKQLNAKAHIYANHADKLKLFISDKLLEYIEYDEKFLHFKSIASEVRHNGVICYDKISTVLEAELNAASPEDGDRFEQLCDTRDSLRYLWDLLDLSTADNIALHIANQVCESEELLFQSELNEEHSAPLEKPVFSPQRALEKSLARCFGTTARHLDTGTDIDDLQIPDHDHVWIRCHPTAPLLGNENHAILALENLINNAQFFAGRRNPRRSLKRSRIALQLDQSNEYIRYRIYNSGPQIDEETAGKLFQLGFSTRRAKEHHGKGLGLYFVHEIVKGYDGRVSFRNISNIPDVLSIRIAMRSGEVITDVIELIEGDSGIYCRKSGEDIVEDSLDWELFGSVDSIEITHQSDQQTHRFSNIANTKSLFDPSCPPTPRWRLDIDTRKKKTTVLKLRALDITGVEFEIKLPSITARLEGDLLATDEDDMDRQVADLTRQFRALEE